MKKLLNLSSEYSFAFLYFTFAILFEVISILTLSGGELFLPKYFLFDLTFILIICGIFILVRNKKMNTFIIILALLIQVVLNVVNAALFQTFGYIFNFDMAKLGAEAARAFEPQFVNWLSVAINLAVFALAIYLVVCINKKIRTKKIINKFSSVLTMFLVVFILQTTGLTSLLVAKTTMIDAQESSALYVAESDVYLYDNMQFTMEAYKKFGVFGFYTKNLENMLFPADKLNDEEIDEYKSYLQEGVVQPEANAQLKGDNFIMIMLESFEWFGIDEHNTPTLWKLMNNEDTITMTKFYARNKTNVSEGISILGNYPKAHEPADLAVADRLDPQYSLANLFRNKGYSSKYFHSYVGTFYQRNTTYEKMGFQDLITLEDVSIEGKSENFYEWVGEENFAKAVIEDLVPLNSETNFFNYYLTVATHGTYDSANPRFADLKVEYENNLPQLREYYESVGYSIPTDEKSYTRFKNYKIACMDTDRMVKYLLDYIETNKANINGDTNIVLFSDHNCYYNDLSPLVKLGGKINDYENAEVYNIPFMIYSPKLEAKKIDTFCSTYDIFPTICELYGLEYNKNLTQGYSVFSPEIEESIFVSFTSGIFDDRLYTNNILEVTNYSSEEVREDEIFEFQLRAAKFYEKQAKIEKIYYNKIKI